MQPLKKRPGHCRSPRARDDAGADLLHHDHAMLYKTASFSSIARHRRAARSAPLALLLKGSAKEPLAVPIRASTFLKLTN